MAVPRKVANLDYEGNRALVSLAGIRPLVQDSVSVGATTEATYTVTHPAVKRVVLCHAASTVLAIRMALGETADATSFPVLPESYFVIDAEKDEVLHLYNTTGAGITVYVVEIY